MKLARNRWKMDDRFARTMDDKTPATALGWRSAPLQAKGKSLRALVFRSSSIFPLASSEQSGRPSPLFLAKRSSVVRLPRRSSKSEDGSSVLCYLFSGPSPLQIRGKRKLIFVNGKEKFRLHILVILFHEGHIDQ